MVVSDWAGAVEVVLAAGSVVADTPTPKAKVPPARWPSTDDTVVHTTE